MEENSVWALTRLQYMLRTHEENAFKTLENNGVKWKTHPEYPNLYQFRYDMLKAKFHNKEVQESRGIILDRDNKWSIVSYPFDKFFNLGEGFAPKIDWDSARAVEKLDGTCAILYYYEGWRVSTLGMPGAGGEVSENRDLTFAELFWEVWNANNYDLPDNTSNTYVFELMSNENKIVVLHEKPRLVLIGVRNNIHGTELNPNLASDRFGWEAAQTYPLSSQEAIEAFVAEMNRGDRVECEGVVVIDGSFNRVKIKNDKYVLLAHLKGSCSTSKLMKVVKANEGSEFLNQFPEWKIKYEGLSAKFQKLQTSLESSWDEYGEIQDRKTFALRASKTRLPSILFSLKDGKISSVAEGLKNTDSKKLLQILGIANEGIR
jgi:hypothetical protein